MQLWLYSPYAHIPCGVIDNHEGLEITHRAIKPGEISFECPLNDTTKLMETDALIWPQGDETAFLVTTCEKRTEATGEEVVSVKGACLKWLLKQRVLVLSKIYTGKSGAVMNQMLSELTGLRAFPRFSAQINDALAAGAHAATVAPDLLRAPFASPLLTGAVAAFEKDYVASQGDRAFLMP